MSSNQGKPILEVTPGDVTIDSDGKVEIVNARLAEAVKAAVRLQKELEGATATRQATNVATCCVNAYHCESNPRS